MAPSTNPTLAPFPPTPAVALEAMPLSPDEHRVIAQTAERLCVEFARVLERFGKHGTSPRALSRTLDVNFRLCQQLTAAVRQGPDDPAKFFQRLPGPQGLRNILDAIARVGPAFKPNSPAEQAMRDFDQLLLQHGGSLASLQRKLELAERANNLANPVSQEYSLTKRRTVQRLMSEVLGYSADIILSTMIMRPLPGDELHTEIVSANGLVGFQSFIGRIPVVQRTWQMNAQATNLVTEARVTTLDGQDTPYPGVLPEFSTSNLPSTSFEAVEGQSRTILYAPPGKPVDVVCAYRSSPHANERANEAFLSNVLLCRRPTRLMILDTYLHRDLARGIKPTVGVFLWHPGFDHDPRINRDDQLPLHPRLELLGTGLTRAGGGGWPRMGELAARLFALAGWNPADFEGFRCEDTVPVWGSMYSMMFDFRTDNGSSRL